MESQRAKRAIKPPKKYSEDEGSWGVDTSTLLTLPGCQQHLVARLRLGVFCRCRAASTRHSRSRAANICVQAVEKKGSQQRLGTPGGADLTAGN